MRRSDSSFLARALPALVVCLVGAMLLSQSGFAQAGLAARQVDVRWKDRTPYVSFSAAHLVDDKVEKALQRGVRKLISLEVEAYVEGSRDPFATRRFGCAVTYDILDDRYVVRMGRNTHLASDIDGVVDRCLHVRNLRVGETSQYLRRRNERVYFAIRVEFDPIQPSRCREMLKSSSSDGPIIGPIVANLTSRKICAPARSIRFRSAVVDVAAGDPR